MYAYICMHVCIYVETIPVPTVLSRIPAKKCRHIPVEPWGFATLRAAVSSGTLVELFISVTIYILRKELSQL